MRSRLILGFSLLGMGVLMGYWLADDPEPHRAEVLEPPTASPFLPAAANDAAKVDELWAQLEQESRARRQLEQRVRTLSQEIARLAEATGSPAPPPDPDPLPEESQAAGDEAAPSAMNRVDALAALGLDPATREQLVGEMESLEMDRLFLRDRAIREGWINSDRYRKASAELESKTQSFVNSLGDDQYDRYLYLTGQPNRVVVTDVLAGSPAAQAGIRAGDMIRRYAGRPVYRWSDLTRATTEGRPQEQVLVELQRNGSRLNLYLPRGPLGVRLNTTRMEPAG